MRNGVSEIKQERLRRRARAYRQRENGVADANQAIAESGQSIETWLLWMKEKAFVGKEVFWRKLLKQLPPTTIIFGENGAPVDYSDNSQVDQKNASALMRDVFTNAQNPALTLWMAWNVILALIGAVDPEPMKDEG